MSVGGILYGGYSYSYQSDFARKTFLCTRRVPQNQVSHSYQYLLATEEQPRFSMGYMNIILQKAQKSIVCCLGGAVPFGSAPLFLFQGGNNYVRVSIRIKADRGLMNRRTSSADPKTGATSCPRKGSAVTTGAAYI